MLDFNINLFRNYWQEQECHTATSSAWLGIGLNLKSFRVDVTNSYHPQLGITPGLLLLFNFNNNEK